MIAEICKLHSVWGSYLYLMAPFWTFFADYELHTSCSHDTLSGQGLCYSCHQRNKKNIFIDVSDEKKTNELKYEKLLQEYQNKKHSMVAAKELDAKNSTQLFAKDTSLYNFRHSQKKVSNPKDLPNYCHK